MTLSTNTKLHAAAIAALALCVTVAGARGAEVTVSDGWMRALPSGLPAGGYFTLHNDSTQTRTLTGASSAACGMLELHKSSKMSGMMHMEHVDRVDVPAHGTVAFAPGGYHLMCTKPSAEIKPGNTVTVRFSFADGSTVDAPFAVRGATGK